MIGLLYSLTTYTADKWIDSSIEFPSISATNLAVAQKIIEAKNAISDQWIAGWCRLSLLLNDDRSTNDPLLGRINMEEL